MADSSPLAAGVTMVAFNKTHIPPLPRSDPWYVAIFFFHCISTQNCAQIWPIRLHRACFLPQPHHIKTTISHTAPPFSSRIIYYASSRFFFSRDTSLNNDHTPPAYGHTDDVCVHNKKSVVSA
jgi:hypothetical protein